MVSWVLLIWDALTHMYDSQLVIDWLNLRMMRLYIFHQPASKPRLSHTAVAGFWELELELELEAAQTLEAKTQNMASATFTSF